MPLLSYRQPGLVLHSRGSRASERQIRDLQRDLRRLGYLKSGIDGHFGAGTRRAVMALQHDLVGNDGTSSGGDGAASVRLVDFNRNRAPRITGEADQPLVECISDLLESPAVPTLPFVQDPVAENRRIVERIQALPPELVPIPFLLAILKQESGLRHFNEPGPGDDDTFIVVGLDARSDEKHVITSRGYGAGQYTLFHHPPRREEVTDFMLDPGKNLLKAGRELKEKFDRFVNGPTRGTRAEDRTAEIGRGALRPCKFDAGDPRFLRDCRQCALDAGLLDIQEGVTPLFPGSPETCQPTPIYKTGTYRGVPARQKVGCDWPYAIRRYNGAGLNSYHYQARVLQHLLTVLG